MFGVNNKITLGSFKESGSESLGVSNLDHLSKRNRETFVKVFKELGNDFNNKKQLKIDEKTWLLMSLVEKVETIPDEELKSFIKDLPFNLPLPGNKRTLSDLGKLLTNAADNTICIKDVMPPVVEFFNYYNIKLGIQKQSFSLDTISEE